MKAYKWINRVLVLLLTATWGLAFGVLAPISMINTPDYLISTHWVLPFWIVFGVVGYFVPCILNTLNLYKLSAMFSVIGTIFLIIIHSVLLGLDIHAEFLYMAQIFMTILTIAYAVAVNWSKVAENKSKKEAERMQKSVSVLKERDE